MAKLATVRGLYVFSIVLIIISLFIPAWSMYSLEDPGENLSWDVYFYGVTAHYPYGPSETISFTDLVGSSQLALAVLFVLSLVSVIVITRHVLMLSERGGKVIHRSGKRGLALPILIILIPISFMILWGNSMAETGYGFWGYDGFNFYGPGLGWFLTIAAAVLAYAGFASTSKWEKQPESPAMYGTSSYVMETMRPNGAMNGAVTINRPGGSMFCRNCGRPIPEGSVSCPYCGFRPVN